MDQATIDGTFTTLQALIAPAAAIVGAWIGAHFTSRSAERRATEDRLESRRREARDVATSLINSGFEWSKVGLISLIDEVSKIRDREERDETSAKYAARVTAAQAEHALAFTRFLLAVADGRPRKLAIELQKTFESMHTVTSPVIEQLWHDSQTKVDFDGIFGYFTDYKAKLTEFRAELMPYVAGKLLSEPAEIASGSRS